MTKKKKNKLQYLIDTENPYTPDIQSQKISLDDFMDFIEHEYGSYLAKVFEQSDLINEYQKKNTKLSE